MKFSGTSGHLVIGQICVVGPVLRVTRLPATPGELTFSTFPYITWRTVYMKNRKFSRLEVVLFGGRVTLQARANVSLYLAHPAGSSRSRRDSLGMRKSCFIQTEHARALLALVKWPSLFSYKRSLGALVYSKSPTAKGYFCW